MRKQRKEIERQAVINEIRERQLIATAGIRKIFKWTGIVLSSAGVLALVVYLAIMGFRSIPQFKVVSGPFGSIKYAELSENKFVTLATNKGDIKIELDVENAPKTSANFEILAKKDFYNGTKFHRVIDGFMIQGGDPNSRDLDPANDGTGGPGYAFENENVNAPYSRGVIAMANSGPNTNGSQFFIVQGEDVQLPAAYSVFGRVVEGMDVVDAIAATKVEDNGQGEVSRPTEELVINSVTVSKE